MEAADHISAPSVSLSLLRKEVERYKSMYEREHEQFEEFQRYSRELESEMELELKQRDHKISELEKVKRRLCAELEGIKTKSDQDRRERNTLEQELRKRANNAEEICAELRQKLRAVEQANDDLERRERIHAQQLLDLGERYDQCLERCAMLEAGLMVPQQEQNLIVNGENASPGNEVETMEVVLAPSANLSTAPDINTSTAPIASSSPRSSFWDSSFGRDSQRLIAQMLRKVEAAEAHLSCNSSSLSATSSSSTMNGYHHYHNSTMSPFRHIQMLQQQQQHNTSNGH